MVETDGGKVKTIVPGCKRYGLPELDRGKFVRFTKPTLGRLANHPTGTLVYLAYGIEEAGKKSGALLPQAEIVKATGLGGRSVLNAQTSVEEFGLFEKLPTGMTGKGAIQFRIKLTDLARPADGERWAKGSPDLLAALRAIPERQRGTAALVALATMLCGGIPGDKYGGAKVSVETIADILQPIGTDGKPSRRRWSASRIDQARKALKDAGIAHRTETEGVHRWTINPPKIGPARLKPTGTKRRHQPERNAGTNRNETTDVLESSSSSYEEDEDGLDEDSLADELPGRSGNDQGFVERAVMVLRSARESRIDRIAVELAVLANRADVLQFSGVRILAAAYRFIQSETQTKHVQGFLKWASQIDEVEAREIVAKIEKRPMGGEPDPDGRPVPEPLEGYNPFDSRERKRACLLNDGISTEIWTAKFAERFRVFGPSSLD